jgi:uncharacterized membrane protein HdeD (DUF308 family)
MGKEPACSEEGTAVRKDCHMANESFFDTARSRFRDEISNVDRKWGWYFALGVFLILLGSLASAIAVATTLVSVVALGWILLIAGAALVISSFLTGNWSGFLLTLAAGALSVMTGFALLSNPFSGAAAITLMVGTILVAAGLYRSIASIAMQFPNWGWALVSGIASFVLGAALLYHWQITSLWFLGLLIGIDLIFHGFSWIMFSLRVHSLAEEIGINDVDRRRAA